MSLKPKETGTEMKDLISFDSELDGITRKVSEIELMFDPFYSAANRNTAVTMKASDVKEELLTCFYGAQNDRGDLSLSRNKILPSDPLPTCKNVNIRVKPRPEEINVASHVGGITDLIGSTNDLDLPNMNTFCKTRKKHVSSVNEQPCSTHNHFIVNSQSTVELRHYVSSVENIHKMLHSGAFNSGSTDGSHSLSVLNNWPYNSVFGRVVQNDSNNIPLNDINPDWKWYSGSCSVAHVSPIESCKSLKSVNGNVPTFVKYSSKWPLPQIDVRILIQLASWKQQHLTTTGIANSKTVENSDKCKRMDNFRLRLVCDPNSTLVSELMAEALVNEVLLAQKINLDAEKFHLRLHGRAELLHPDAYLRDCYQVQVCYRLDQPLTLVLEPKYMGLSTGNKNHSVKSNFNPNSCLGVAQHIPSENSIFVTYNIFLNTVAKLRNCIVDNNNQVNCMSWFNEIQCVGTGLIQSLKAVLAASCQAIAFPDVLHALGNVQVCIMEIVNDAGVPRHIPNLHGMSFTANIDSMHSKKQSSAVKVYRPQICEDLKSSTINLKTAIKLQSRKKLNDAIKLLVKHLLGQMNAFFQLFNLGLSIAPHLFQLHAYNHLGGIQEADGLFLLNCSSLKPVHSNTRPKAVLIDEQRLDQLLKEKDCWESDPDQAKTVKSSLECTDPFLVGLIAIHRPPTRTAVFTSFSSISSSSSSLSASSNFTGSMTNSYPFSDNMSSGRSGGENYYYVRLALVYAGKPLGRINTREPHLQSNEVVRRATRCPSRSAKDFFISDPGRYQTLQAGFPKVLRFDQWFNFPGFPVNTLPRETLLAISLFSCKKYNAENTETDGNLIGWANVPLFSADNRLKQNNVVVGLWPVNESMHNYRPTWSQSNISHDCPVVQISLPEYQYEIEFPKIDANSLTSTPHKVYPFASLCMEAKKACHEALRAVWMQTLNPELSLNSANHCLSVYSTASSTLHRVTNSTEHIPLPVLHLNALKSLQNSTNSSVNGSNVAHNGSSLNSTFCCLSDPPAVAIEVLWNLRHAICDMPEAMVSLISNCFASWPHSIRMKPGKDSSSWTWIKLSNELYRLMSVSKAPPAGLALRLLAFDVVDQGVRHWAVRSLALLPTALLAIYLPQLLESINHDLYFDYSGLASLLLCRAAFSMHFANTLHWNLHSLLSQSKSTTQWKMSRLRLLKSGLLWLASERLNEAWRRQLEVTNKLSAAAMAVKQCKPNASLREEILHSHLNDLMTWLNDDSQSSINKMTEDVIGTSDLSHKQSHLPLITAAEYSLDNNSQGGTNNMQSMEPPIISQFDLGLRMPYDPGLLTYRLDIKACSYFTSFTCPLRLVFHALDAEAEPFMVMFKVGDDLRLDALICQLTFLMDRIWLESGLDLRMVHFRVIPTEDLKGYIELVPECSTLRQIQQQGGGLTGPFKESVITKWLQSQNNTELDYRRALDNFLRSLAGCSVATYILGVCDRHNDNIMLRHSGHVFHVDFAKVFGNSQTFAGFKRDRVPFVFTQDMLHVLHTYSREFDYPNMNNSNNNATISGNSSGNNLMNNLNQSQGVQLFIERCCEAYNLLRHRIYELISLLELGLSLQIPGLNQESIQFVVRTLKPELTDQQASQHFTEMFRKTLQSKSTALNFFVHGLAQAKQAASSGISLSNTNTMNHHLINSPTESDYSFRSDALGNYSPARSNNHMEANLSNDDTNMICSNGNSTIEAWSEPSRHSGQLLSFNPKRYSIRSDGCIDAVVVECALKKRTDTKHMDYYLPMNVWRSDCRVPTRIFRRICHIEELVTCFQVHFPESHVTKTCAQIISALNTMNISSPRTQDQIQSLIDCVLHWDAKVKTSDLVYTFFHSVLFDEKFAADDSLSPKKGCNPKPSRYWPPSPTINSGLIRSKYTNECSMPLLTASKSVPIFHTDTDDLSSSICSFDQSPAIQIQLHVSDDCTRMDVLIKQGRYLCVPGTKEAPDVYVKVEFISPCGSKSTKQRTATICRSTSPIFNANFSCDLTMVNRRLTLLDVSAWRVVQFGEDIPFGQICIKLDNIRPGEPSSEWYPLYSDNRISTINT